jgi:uncharacterized damage-inducible protein DinB
MRLTPILAAATLFVAPVLCARSMKAAAAAPAVPKSGFRAEFLHDLEDVEKKIMQLAMAMPASKYSWRPARGVRSVSEVYMHIAGGNYFAAATIASKQGSGEAETLEQIADKQRVLDELRRSFEQLRGAALNITDADLDKSVKMVGSDISERGALMTALTHLHEHLGQSIAYARMNGIAPPWSGM